MKTRRLKTKVKVSWIKQRTEQNQQEAEKCQRFQPTQEVVDCGRQDFTRPSPSPYVQIQPYAGPKP